MINNLNFEKIILPSCLCCFPFDFHITQHQTALHKHTIGTVTATHQPHPLLGIYASEEFIHSPREINAQRLSRL